MTQQVKRAAQILGVLGSGIPRLGVTEIAARLGLAKPTVYRLLRSLESHGLVAQDRGTGKYGLGPDVLMLGKAYLNGSELRTRSLAWAQSLAHLVQEAVWVGSLSGSAVIVLHQVFRPDRTVQIFEVGTVIPWHACALGHAIVAHLPEAQQAGALSGDLAPLTGRTKSPRADISRVLAQVRVRGYAIESEETTVGGASIASPIRAHDGSVVGAIAVVGAAGRLLTPETRGEVVGAVRETALAISKELSAAQGDAAAPDVT